MARRKVAAMRKLTAVTSLGGVLLVVGSLGAAGALGASGGAAVTRLEAKLSGRAEVPRGAPAGKGGVDLTLSGRRLCWDFTISGIDKPLVAHIHRAPAGMSGPIIVPLGRRYTQQGCTSTSAAVSKAIVTKPGGFYVNVHTARFPTGAIRGQLARP
jgi:hypothetical protein